MLTWLKWQLIRLDYWMMYRSYKKMGDRYYLRDDEVCRDDECVARVREAGQ